MIDPLILFIGVIAVGAAVMPIGLIMLDFVRRGRLHRRSEALLQHGGAVALPEGRVPCPECAEAILPAARRCPFCRSVVSPRT